MYSIIYVILYLKYVQEDNCLKTRQQIVNYSYIKVID